MTADDELSRRLRAAASDIDDALTNGAAENTADPLTNVRAGRTSRVRTPRSRTPLLVAIAASAAVIVGAVVFTGRDDSSSTDIGPADASTTLPSVSGETIGIEVELSTTEAEDRSFTGWWNPVEAEGALVEDGVPVRFEQGRTVIIPSTFPDSTTEWTAIDLDAQDPASVGGLDREFAWIVDGLATPTIASMWALHEEVASLGFAADGPQDLTLSTESFLAVQDPVTAALSLAECGGTVPVTATVEAGEIRSLVYALDTELFDRTVTVRFGPSRGTMPARPSAEATGRLRTPQPEDDLALLPRCSGASRAGVSVDRSECSTVFDDGRGVDPVETVARRARRTPELSGRVWIGLNRSWEPGELAEWLGNASLEVDRIGIGSPEPQGTVMRHWGIEVDGVPADRAAVIELATSGGPGIDADHSRAEIIAVRVGGQWADIGTVVHSCEIEGVSLVESSSPPTGTFFGPSAAGNELEQWISTAVGDGGWEYGCCGEPSEGGTGASTGVVYEGSVISIVGDRTEVVLDSMPPDLTTQRLPFADGEAIEARSSAGRAVLFTCGSYTIGLGWYDETPVEVDSMLLLGEALIARLPCDLREPAIG